MTLDDALAVVRHDARRISATIPPEWCINERAHGGFLAALAERVCRAALDRTASAARSFTVHYLRGVTAGPIDFDTTIEHAGRSLATVTFRMRHNGGAAMVGVASYASPGGPFEYNAPIAPPPYPVAGALDRTLDVPYVPRGFLEMVDVRLAHDPPLFSGSDSARVGGWAKLAERRAPDLSTLLVLCDSFPRALMATQTASPRVPPPTTMLHLLVHERNIAARVGAEDFVMIELTTRRVNDGFFDEDGVLWAPDGTLLAQTRQLAINIV